MRVYYVLKGPEKALDEYGNECWFCLCTCVEGEKTFNQEFYFETLETANKFRYDVNYNMEGLELDV